MRTNGEDQKLYDPRLEMGTKFGTLSQTLGGTYTMDRDMPTALFLDPGGATRILLLPPEERGLAFFIANTADAAEDLTVKDDSNTNTIGTISQNETAWVVCDGTVWRICVGTTT